ncbi:phosphate butyryltransferase [Heyndrickxia oleronia]|uniref:phosphate butyryltransferase n=1 Tax=Heyndrickxia oleronia TaxID=38875 RepID=UPI00203EAFAF|nr:phosphate butyryltransferase [Heyndrickxia oleronia]MCM3236946.1 phosphate butyryltransferase [Heyndrickxia oleronia]
MNLDGVIKKATQQNKAKVAIASAEDYEVLEAVSLAVEHRLASFLLYGSEKGIYELIDRNFPQLIGHEDIAIIHAESNDEAAKLAVLAVGSGNAHVLMKGNIPTAKLLKTVLKKEYGLRTGNVLSHVAAFEVPAFDRLIFVSDAAMNIEPDVEQKAHIINNSVQIARATGIELPKVAVLAAVEVINPTMKATLDAAALTQMNNRGQIKNCLVDGPLALDNAISLEAAEHKGIHSDVAGQADILLVPTIETGNALYKSLIYFAKAKVAAVIAGAKVPIVLTSRADSAENKLYSLALAICSSN